MGYWKCKKCGSTNFKKTEIIERETRVSFDEDGFDEELKELYEDSKERIECENCGNTGNIFNEIESIAEWVEEK